MSSIPDQPAGRTVHPAWCDRQHNEDYPVHTADIGDQDIELGDTDLSVSLYQQGDGPALVWLCEHQHDNTTVTALSADQATTLGQRLLEAAQTITAGGYPHRAPLGEGNSGPGGAR